MIIEKTGDILSREGMPESQHRAIVSPVNCVGVSGAGLAKQMRLHFPDYHRLYLEDCNTGELIVGRPTIIIPDQRTEIILFPTKNNWRNPSEYEYIRDGLWEIKKMVEEGEIIDTIAMPKIGCGLGGLDWNTVYFMIESILGDLQVDIEVYV